MATLRILSRPSVSASESPRSNRRSGRSTSASELENAFDHLFDDDEAFPIGDLGAKVVVHLPGHTPDHVGYLIGGELHEQQDPFH
jgi:glyoxylase-like metal-dependent hydrolase (beta-lactamase superfamily II)